MRIKPIDQKNPSAGLIYICESIEDNNRVEFLVESSSDQIIRYVPKAGKGSRKMETPYTTSLVKTRPGFSEVVKTFKVEAEKLHKMREEARKLSYFSPEELAQRELRKVPKNAYEAQVHRVERAWDAIVKTAYWTTKSGKQAYVVVGNELVESIRTALTWDEYDAVEEGASGTFVSAEEQLAAATAKFYAKARAMGVTGGRLERHFTPEELSAMMHQKEVYRLVDKLELEYDRELLRNPKVGTIREKGRRRREAEEFIATAGRMLNPIRDNTAKEEYTKSVLTYLVRKELHIRTLLLNWNKNINNPRLKAAVETAKRGYYRMHLTMVANQLLVMLQELGLLTKVNPLSEYKAERAGEKHKASTWQKKEESEAVDVMSTAVEYIDITSVDESLDPEQQLMEMEEFIDEEGGESFSD